ncbi:MAG: IscS subfamily cysteine desulfurase [Gammaproteobacteria bacterium]|nr:IscS subfamily cysteine desulfurase [Gammaproteobacteria bacterium]
MNLPIYLDYAATTPVDPRVAQKMCGCLTRDGVFGNPASTTHQYGWVAAKLVEDAREQVADLIEAKPREIIWTSGATESDNLAIKGVALFYQHKGKHIVTSKVEHKAVLGVCRYLESLGFEITYLTPQPDGSIVPEQVEEALRDDTILVSLMHVNNEIGSVTDIAKIGEITRAHHIIFHVDAAQSAGKIPINLKELNVDLMSFSAHKIYGPKGMGALFVRNDQPKVRLVPVIHGSEQEWGLRAGTLPTHQIVGMGEAFHIAKSEIEQESKRIANLRQRLWNGLKDIEAIQLNGNLDKGASHLLNVSFNYIEGEALIMALKNIAVSTGSACTSASLKPSYVLKALGLSDELAHSSIRFSFGRFTTEAEIDYTIHLVKEKVAELRNMSPLWDMYKAGINISTIEWGEH